MGMYKGKRLKSGMVCKKIVFLFGCLIVCSELP